MSDLPHKEWTEADLLEIEQMIDRAKGFAVVSDELRPAVVDAVKLANADSVHLAKLRNLILLALALWLTVLGVFAYLDSNRKRFTAPTATEVQQRSHDYAEQRGYSHEWGMVEVFREMRRNNSAQEAF